MVARIASTRGCTVALHSALLVVGVAASSAQALETRLVTSALDTPLFLTAPAGDPRLFVVERGGTIRIIQDGVLLSQPFLDIRTQVESATGERGLLGLAFDPNYSSNGKFYVDYIDSTTAHNTQIASFTVSPGNPNIANPSGTSILSINQPTFSNHKAGWIGFRPNEPDNLYIATGDGGDANDPGNRAQSLSSDLGKILRIDVQHPANGQILALVPEPSSWASMSAGLICVLWLARRRLRSDLIVGGARVMV